MTLATLYVVDNCLLARVSKKRYLKKLNYDIAGDFSSIMDCVDAMENSSVDMILIDADLLSMNIFNAIKFLKKVNSRIKIMVTASCINEGVILNSLSEGINAYIFKDKKGANFQNIIETVAKGRLHMDIEMANKVFDNVICEKQEAPVFSDRKDFKNNLTQRELEVLKLMIDGKTNSQIAREIIVSINTAKAHVGNILTKLSVTDRVQAVVKAVRANIF